MGVKDSFLSSSLVIKITFFVALVGNICSWISFTTSSWYSSVSPYPYVGLWRKCDGRASFGAVQAFAIFGFVSLNIGFILLNLFMFWNSCKGNGETRWVSAILFIVSAMTWLISVIVFSAKVFNPIDVPGTNLEFSFGLAIVSLILSFVAGILLIFAESGSGSVGSK